MLKISCMVYMNVHVSRESHVCREGYERMHVRFCWLFSCSPPNAFLPLPQPAMRPGAVTWVGCVWSPVVGSADGRYQQKVTGKQECEVGDRPTAPSLAPVVAVARCHPRVCWVGLHVTAISVWSSLVLVFPTGPVGSCFAIFCSFLLTWLTP